MDGFLELSENGFKQCSTQSSLFVRKKLTVIKVFPKDNGDMPFVANRAGSHQKDSFCRFRVNELSVLGRKDMHQMDVGHALRTLCSKKGRSAQFVLQKMHRSSDGSNFAVLPLRGVILVPYARTCSTTIATLQCERTVVAIEEDPVCLRSGAEQLNSVARIATEHINTTHLPGAAHIIRSKCVSLQARQGDIESERETLWTRAPAARGWKRPFLLRKQEIVHIPEAQRVSYFSGQVVWLTVR